MRRRRGAASESEQRRMTDEAALDRSQVSSGPRPGACEPSQGGEHEPGAGASQAQADPEAAAISRQRDESRAQTALLGDDSGQCGPEFHRGS